VTNRSAICHFLLVSHCNRTCISNCFRDIRPPLPVRTPIRTSVSLWESSRNGLVGNRYAYNANLWGNNKMAMWGIDTSPQDHSVHYFSIAFTRWRYQFPHRDSQRQQWLPTTRACERSVSVRFAAHRSSPLSAPLQSHALKHFIHLYSPYLLMVERKQEKKPSCR